MVLLAMFGILTILAGFYACTNRVDHYWKTRHPRPTATPKPKPDIPPFIHSETQCVECGIDGDLLNLDHQCRECYERTYSNG